MSPRTSSCRLVADASQCVGVRLVSDHKYDFSVEREDEELVFHLSLVAIPVPRRFRLSTTGTAC